MAVPTTSLRSRLRLPISIRLTLWYGLSMLVLLMLFGGLLVTTVHWQQHIILHQQLFRAQTELVEHVVVEAQAVRLRPALAELGGAYQTQGALGTFVRLLSPEGRVLEQSTNFGNAAVFDPTLPGETEIWEVQRHWQDQPMRSLYTPLVVQDEHVGWLEVSRFSLNLQLHMVGLPVGIAILVTVLLAIGGGYILARRALRPVARLADAANRITASALNIQLPVEKRWRDELTDLAETFNTMLARLGASFARERRFTADAAHELLNPLAAVRNEAEVALRRPRETAAYQHTLRTILTDVERLGTMIEQLLQLARIEADADLPRERVDLSQLSKEATTRWQAAASSRTLRLTCSAAQPATVCANTVYLDTVLDNLLENAVKYTPEGGSVKVDVEIDDQQVMLTVSDTGVGFDPAIAQQLFDRFHRVATTEVQAQPGSGLGLAIVRAIVQAYGGSITASSEGPGQGSRFVVCLPRETV